MASKYKNRKVLTVDGQEFDSKKEYKRWNMLRLCEMAGEIQNLRRQVPFELIPTIREPDTVGKRGGIKKGKVIERAVVYIADFVYEQDGITVVEDVKGYRHGTAYSVFALKRKLMLWRHNIKVREI